MSSPAARTRVPAATTRAKGRAGRRRRTTTSVNPSTARRPGSREAGVRDGGVAVKLPAGPQYQNPKFMQTLTRLDQSTNRAKKHPPASLKAEQAQKAALAPPNEKVAVARANQVGEMSAADTPKPQSNRFLAMLRAEIQKVMPKKVEDGKEFMKGDDRQQLKQAMNNNVIQQKEAATSEMHQAANAPLDTSSIPGKEVTPLPNEPPPAALAPVNAGQAMPGPKPEKEVSLQKEKKSTELLMKNNELTDNQMQKANDPRFAKVLSTKTAANQYADRAMGQFRAGEQRSIGQVAAQATAEENRSLQGIHRVQGGTSVGVYACQMAAKQKNEARSKEVVDQIQAIFDKTKRTVDQKIESIEKDVNNLFDRGIDQAIERMKDYVETRFADRYSGPIGWGRWVKDRLLPLPPGVRAWFDHAHQQFMSDLDALVVRVANLVESRLKEAKTEINKGMVEIRKYVASLPADLQAVGRTAEQKMNSKFNELRQGVDEKKNDLAQKLAQKYKDAHEKGESALKEMKDTHKSLYERVQEAIQEVLKVLREFRAKVAAMLKMGKHTIDLIVSDPIAFLRNLLNAIRRGLGQFVNNIWTHLKAGFMKWLFSSLANTGIQMPADLSLGSILKLVLHVLGLTYARIRPKIVRIIGERNTAMLEKAFEVIKVLWEGGPSALWEKIKEFLGDLKSMVMDAIQDWIITTIIKTAVTKLATMFNPVGAIIQAIITIYNTIMFLIERIRQIMEFVEAVINSVHKIATGAIGDAANWIEKAMARTIPIIISFLARLLGLGGISDKIVGIIKKIQTKVDKAVDKLIAKIVGGIGRLLGRDKRPESSDPKKEAKLQRGFAALDAVSASFEKSDIDKEELREAVARVKQQHPVFKSLALVEKGKRFAFEYEASPKNEKLGPVIGPDWVVGEHRIAHGPPKKAKVKGESHHVPQKVIKRWIGEFYIEIAKGTQDPNERKEIKRIGKEFRDDDVGNGLSAIWVTKKAHKRIHKPLIAKPAEIQAAAIEVTTAASAKNTFIVRSATSGRISASLRRGPLTYAVAQEINPNSRARTRAGLIRNILKSKGNKINTIFKRVFDGALTTGVLAVERGKLTGNIWKVAIVKLARHTWKNIIKPKI